MGQAVRDVTEIETEVSTGKVARGLGWSTASNLTLKLANFAVSIVMARLIAPEEFGVFAVALTVWTICGTMAEFGLGTDLVRARDLERRIPTVATMGLLTSGALALGMFLSASPIALAFDSPASAAVIRVMSVSMLVFGLGIVPAAVLQREFRQRALFTINGASLAVSTMTMILLATDGFGPMALAIGQVAGQCVTVGLLYLVTHLRIRLAFDRVIARESAGFCLPLALANTLSWALLSVDNFIIARAMGPTQLGLYVLAFNVSSWPMGAVGQSIRVVALPAFSHLTTGAMRNRAIKDISGPLWAVSIFMGLCLATLAGPVIELLYGARWSPAATALVGLGVFGALRVIFDLIATFLIAAGATREVLVVQVWWLVAMVPCMWVGVSWFGLAGAGWAHVVVALVAVLPAYLYYLRRVEVDPIAFLRGALLPLVLAVPASIACLWIARHVASPLPAVIVGGLSATALYAAPLASYVWRCIQQLRSNQSSITSQPMNEAR
jgi:lipopolysaccharide exporter